MRTKLVMLIATLLLSAAALAQDSGGPSLEDTTAWIVLKIDGNPTARNGTRANLFPTIRIHGESSTPTAMRLPAGAWLPTRTPCGNIPTLTRKHRNLATIIRPLTSRNIIRIPFRSSALTTYAITRQFASTTKLPTHNLPTESWWGFALRTSKARFSSPTTTHWLFASVGPLTMRSHCAVANRSHSDAQQVWLQL